jgi:hypothetical protein
MLKTDQFLGHNFHAGNEEAPHALTMVQLFSFGVLGEGKGREWGNFFSGLFLILFTMCSECVRQDVPNITALLSHMLFVKVEKGDMMII